jgi:FkbM family methyltransferase
MPEKLAAISQPVAEATAPSPVPPPLTCEGFNCLKRCRHGYVLYNRNDRYIGRSLEAYGEYSEAEIDLLCQVLNAGDTVVEVGANIGAHTLPLAQHVGPSGVVYAFEPQRILFQTLCANMALNGVTNAHCHQVAVGQAAGHIVVPWLDYGVENNFGGLGLGGYRDGERVAQVTLDQLGLARCRLLKIDVEGMEQQVLEGAAGTVARCRPFLYVENDRQEKSASLIAWLLNAAYRLYWHLPRLFNPGNYFSNPENLFGNIVSVNMLCVPEETGLLIDGLRPIHGPDSRWQQT